MGYCTCWPVCNFQSSARQVCKGGTCPWQGSGQERSADQSYWSGTGQLSSIRNCECDPVCKKQVGLATSLRCDRFSSKVPQSGRRDADAETRTHAAAGRK